MPNDTAAGIVDIRSLPSSARHARIFSVLEQMAPGTSFILVSEHDPQPLRRHIQATSDGIVWEDIAPGPAVWRIRIGKVDDRQSGHRARA